MIFVVAFSGLVLAAGFALRRVMRGPTLADRVMGLDLILIITMAGIAIDSARRDDPTGLQALVVLAIVGFIATVAASRAIEHRGRGRRATTRPGGTT